jgi:carbon storage regulator
MIPEDFAKVEKARNAEGPPGMLVVTRKKDEKLIIGNEIEIQVLRIGRDNVRLGIKAPTHISIYRYEIYEAIKQENVSAVQSQIPDKDTMETLKGVLKGDSVLKGESKEE